MTCSSNDLSGSLKTSTRSVITTGPLAALPVRGPNDQRRFTEHHWRTSRSDVWREEARVLRLVEGQLAATWHLDRRYQPEALVADRTAELDSLGREFGDRGVDVVAHQVELVMGRSLCGVGGQLGRR